MISLEPCLNLYGHLVINEYRVHIVATTCPEKYPDEDRLYLDLGVGVSTFVRLPPRNVFPEIRRVYNHLNSSRVISPNMLRVPQNNPVLRVFLRTKPIEPDFHSIVCQALKLAPLEPLPTLPSLQGQ